MPRRQGYQREDPTECLILAHTSSAPQIPAYPILFTQPRNAASYRTSNVDSSSNRSESPGSFSDRYYSPGSLNVAWEVRVPQNCSLIGASMPPQSSRVAGFPGRQLRGYFGEQYR